MLELKRLELHHLLGNNKASSDIKAALKLQLKTFMEVKYKHPSDKAALAADKYVETQTVKIEEALKNKNIDRAEDILNKYNDVKYKNHFMFTDMMNTLKDDEISKRFDKAIIKRLNTESESRGLLLLAFENNVNSNKTYNQTRLYKALSNFDENNKFMSKAKIKGSLNSNNYEDDSLTKAIKVLKNNCKNTGKVVAGTIGFALSPLYDMLNDYLQKQKEQFEAILGDGYAMIKNALLFLKELVLFTYDVACKTVKKTIDSIDNVYDERLEERRKNKFKNVQKLKYKVSR